MKLIDLIKLQYYVINGQAYNGMYSTDYAVQVPCTHVDPLLTNAKNLLVALDSAQYLVFDLVATIDDNNINEPMLLTRARAYIDVMRMSIAAATGEELPDLIFPQEYNNCGHVPVSTPATDTIERLTRKDTVQSVATSTDNVIQVLPSRWRNKRGPQSVA